jgi:hypothetical protein
MLFSLLIVILFALGTLLVIAGVQACRDRSYQYQWRTSARVLLASRSDSGTSESQGREAVRQGVGLSFFGLMLCLWGLGVAWLCIARKSFTRCDGQAGRVFGQIIGWGSFCSLVLGAVLFFPVWRPIGIACWSYVLLCSSVPSIVDAFGKGSTIGGAYALLAGGIVFGAFLAPQVSVGMACGLVVFIIGFGHMAFLRPDAFKKKGESG